MKGERKKERKRERREERKEREGYKNEWRLHGNYSVRPKSSKYRSQTPAIIIIAAGAAALAVVYYTCRLGSILTPHLVLRCDKQEAPWSSGFVMRNAKYTTATGVQGAKGEKDTCIHTYTYTLS